MKVLTKKQITNIAGGTDSTDNKNCTCSSGATLNVDNEFDCKMDCCSGDDYYIASYTYLDVFHQCSERLRNLAAQLPLVDDPSIAQL